MVTAEELVGEVKKIIGDPSKIRNMAIAAHIDILQVNAAGRGAWEDDDKRLTFGRCRTYFERARWHSTLHGL